MKLKKIQSFQLQKYLATIGDRDILTEYVDTYPWKLSVYSQ